MLPGAAQVGISAQPGRRPPSPTGQTSIIDALDAVGGRSGEDRFEHRPSVRGHGVVVIERLGRWHDGTRPGAGLDRTDDR